MRAERVGAETLLAQIVQMVAEAQRSRAPIQKLADVVAGYFVPAVVAIAVITFVVWALIGPAPAMAYALVNAVAVLIIACPCALGLATPMSIMVGDRQGRRGRACCSRTPRRSRLLRKVDTLVVDKTGTLTEGRPKLISSSSPLPVRTRTSCCAWRPALERGSEHPLADAIVAGAEERGLELPAGRGVRVAHRQGGRGAGGRTPRRARQPRRCMTELGIEAAALGDRAEKLRGARARR